METDGIGSEQADKEYPSITHLKWHTWLWWPVVSALAWTIACPVSFFLPYSFATLFGTPAAWVTSAISMENLWLAWVSVSMIDFGIAIGFIQLVLLKTYISSKKTWIGHTAIGWVVGIGFSWLLLTVLTPPEFNAGLIVATIVPFAMVGLGQWLVVRRVAKRSLWWFMVTITIGVVAGFSGNYILNRFAAIELGETDGGWVVVPILAALSIVATGGFLSGLQTLVLMNYLRSSNYRKPIQGSTSP